MARELASLSKAPESAPSSRAREAGLLAALAALVLGLYLGFPDKVYVFDGVMFAGVIERGVDEWRRELFNRRHLLFNPFFMGLRDALAWLGAKTAGYPLVQKTNAVFGLLGLLVYWRLVSKLVRDAGLWAAATAVLAVSFSYWSRATEGQVYMGMTFGALATACSALSLAASGTARAGAALALVFVGAVLFHAANVALAPMAAAALWLAWRRRGGWALWWVVPLIILGVAFPYAWAFELKGAGALLSFFFKATEFYSPQGGDTWGELFGRFLGSGGLGPWARLKLVLGELFLSLVSPPVPASLQVAGGAAIAAGAAAAAWAGLRRRESREPAALLLLWALGSVGLNAFWLGGLFFWAAPLAALLALGCLALEPAPRSPAGRRRATLGLCAALVLGLGAWNLRAGIGPNSRIENNLGYRRSLFVRDHTVASSWVVISGRGYANAKVYLPYFAQRSREVLEYYLDRHPKDEALRLFGAFVRSNIDQGIPLYLLPDMVDDEAALEQIRKTWGVSVDDLRRCFGPGRLYFMAAQDQDFRVYLFIPDGREERLFAVMGYSVLTETNLERLRETAKAMKELGREMSPAQRRRTAQVMRETNYGARLLFAGFLPYMNDQSRTNAEQRLRNFGEFQKTPDFHLRLGNLYRYLGLNEEVRRVWGEAYRQTRDPGLARDIANLK